MTLDANSSANDFATEIFQSDKGWFVGLADEEGAPFLRESGYFPTREDAASALGDSPR